MKKFILKFLTASNNDVINVCMLMLRCTIGIILFIVGAQKTLGWFEGMGMNVIVESFGKIGISAPLAYLSSYTEFIGGFLLAVGLLTRPVAIAVVINMAVATGVMLPRGFFAGGASYPFTFLVCSVIILLAGPTKLSIDNLLWKSGK